MSLFDKIGKSIQNRIKNVSTTRTEGSGIAKKSTASEIFVSSQLSDKFDDRLIGSQIGITFPEEDESITSRLIRNAGADGAGTSPDLFGGGKSAGSTSSKDSESEPAPSETLIPLMSSDEEGEGTTTTTIAPILIGDLSGPQGVLSEVQRGILLEGFDKPAVLGILENDIISNGFPRESTLFMRRVNTDKFKEIKYTIFRKAIFYETAYFQIATIDGNKIVVDEKYKKFAENNFNTELKQMFTFTDTNLRINQVYAYKLKAEYRELSDREKATKNKNFEVFNETIGNSINRNIGIDFFSND